MYTSLHSVINTSLNRHASFLLLFIRLLLLRFPCPPSSSKFEEFRAIIMEVVPRQEVNHLKALQKMKADDKAAEQHHDQEAERLRVANLPTVDAEVASLWSQLMESHQESSAPNKSRHRLPKR